MPVDVVGDCQWGVNRTAKGWAVWMFNNKGVEKYFGESEKYDLSKTVTVKISFRGKDDVTNVKLAPGEWKMCEFDF
jgi:hypothetical protein